MNLLIEASENGTAVLMATHDMSLINKYPAKIFNVEENNFVQN